MNKKLRCLVLGGNGFIGSHLVDALLDRGFSVKSFDKHSTINFSDNSYQSKNIEIVEGNFLCDDDLKQALVGCDICFHLISTTLPKSSNSDPAFDVETNLVGTIKLLNHAVTSGVKKIVFISSGGTVYGEPIYLPVDENHPTNPICSHGITKLAIEKYLFMYWKLYGLDYMILRLSNPFGERQRTLASQGAIAVFLGKALRGEKIEIWGDGSVIRDYIHISDVINAIILALNSESKDKLFNVGSGIGASLNEIIGYIETVLCKKIERQYSESRTFDVPVSILSVDRARNELGWIPEVSLLDGIDKTARWMQSISPQHLI